MPAGAGIGSFRTFGSFAFALAFAASSARETFGAQDTPPPPEQPKPQQARDGHKDHKHPPNKPSSGFMAGKSWWSRLSAAEHPEDVKEPDGGELAARLGLEVVGPSEPAQIVHYRHPKTGMLFVFVPGGDFPMGSNHGDIYANRQIADSARRGEAEQKYFDSEQPQNSIYVSPFFIGVYEVTNAEYARFLEEWRAGGFSKELEWPLAEPKDHTPHLWRDPEYPFWDDRQPIVGITWLDAWAFARWMGGRLPSEAEWEKAARGTDGRLWPWGNYFDATRANTAESQNRRTLEVGTYPGGRSVYGCYDMAGNVTEYCVDAYDENAYRFYPHKDPCLLEREPLSDKRVVRGGRWNRFGQLHTARCTARGQIQFKVKFPAADNKLDPFPVTEYFVLGLRVVLSPDVDLFPEGAVARIRERNVQIAEERRKAQEKRAGAAGKPHDDSDHDDDDHDHDHEKDEGGGR